MGKVKHLIQHHATCYVLLSIWLLAFSLSSTTTFGAIIPSAIFLGLRALVLSLFMLRIFLNQQFNWLAWLMLALFSIIAVTSQDLYLIDTVIIILVASKMNFTNLIKVYFFTLSIVFIVTIVASHFQWIENRIFYRFYSAQGNVDPRYSLGFVYATIGSVYWMHLVALFFYLFRRLNRLTVVIVSLMMQMGNYWLFVLTDSRISYYLTTLLLACMVVFLLVPQAEQLVTKGARYLVVSVMGLTLIGVLILPLKNDIAIVQRADALLSGRVSLNQRAYEEVGVGIVGNPIEFRGNADIHYYQGESYNGDYFFIDSSPVYIMIKYGALMTIVIFLVFSRYYWRLAKFGSLITLTIALIIFINGLVNPQFFVLMYNPFIIQAFIQDKEALYESNR